VSAGEEMAADFGMRHVLSVEISGKVLGHDGGPSTHAYVRLEQAGVEDGAFGDFSSDTDKDGHFSLKNVPPGNYIIIANEFEMGEQKYWHAQQKIEVGERKIDSIVLAVGRGSNIHGHVTFSGRGSSPDSSRTFLALEPAGESDDNTGAWATVKKDGTFEITDVLDGSYVVRIHSRDSSWYPKSVRFGADDVLERGLQVEKGSGNTLEIVMSSAGATLEGTVTQKDKPAVAAHVRIHPELETPFNHLRSNATSTDQNGHFSIANLAPGRYVVTAKLASEAGATRPASEAQTITLHEGDRQSLQLALAEPKEQ